MFIVVSIRHEFRRCIMFIIVSIRHEFRPRLGPLSEDESGGVVWCISTVLYLTELFHIVLLAYSRATTQWKLRSNDCQFQVLIVRSLIELHVLVLLFHSWLYFVWINFKWITFVHTRVIILQCDQRGYHHYIKERTYIKNVILLVSISTMFLGIS